MPEYFIVANHKDSPFYSDVSKVRKSGDDPKSVLEKYIEYFRCCGLYYIEVFASEDDYYNGQPALIEWKEDWKETEIDDV